MPRTSPLRARFQPGMERASPVRVFQSQLEGVVCRSQRLDVVRGFRSRIRRTNAKLLKCATAKIVRLQLGFIV